MKIRNVIGLALITSTPLLNTSCQCKHLYDSRKELLLDVMQNHTQKEFDDIEKSVFSCEMADEILVYQHKSDSIAYSDAFMQQKGTDLVTKYAKKIEKGVPSLHCYSDPSKKLSETVSVKEFQQIQKEADVFDDYMGIDAYKQFKLDSVLTRNFLKEFNLLNDTTIQKFNKICKKLNPKNAKCIK